MKRITVGNVLPSNSPDQSRETPVTSEAMNSHGAWGIMMGAGHIGSNVELRSQFLNCQLLAAEAGGSARTCGLIMNYMGI